MGGDTFINTKVLEIELAHIKELVQKNSVTVDKLYNIIAGNGGSPSVLSRLLLLENEQEHQITIVAKHEENIKDFSALKNRLYGFTAAIGAATGTIGAGLVKIFGG